MSQRTSQSVKLKILLLGSTNSGKSTFLKANISTDSLTGYTPTVGTQFFSNTSRLLGPNAEVSLFFVDSSESVSLNQDYVSSLVNRANIAFVFFECSNKDSITKAQSIINHLRASSSSNNLPISL